MSPVRALPRRTPSLPALQVAMAAQGVAFAAGTQAFPPGRWMPLALGAGAGSLVLAWFLGHRTRSAWMMALGFEVLLVALGAAALQASVDLPGAVVSLPVAVALVVPPVRRLFADDEPVLPARKVATLSPAVIAPSTRTTMPPTMPPAMPPPAAPPTPRALPPVPAVPAQAAAPPALAAAALAPPHLPPPPPTGGLPRSV